MKLSTIIMAGSMFLFSVLTLTAQTGSLSYDEFRAKQNSFDSEDGTMKYIDQGSGPVILLLHGVPTSGWLYRKMIDPITEKGYRVIVPDMLGFGSSDSPKGYELYSQEQHAKRLTALMNHLKINSWTHVMHDAGGLWTWETFIKAPGKIERLVILNTIIYEEGFHPPIRMKKGLFAKISMWMYKNGITTNVMLKALFKAALMENNLTDREVDGYKRPLREGKTNSLYFFFSKTCQDLPDYSPLIKEKINIPVKVIWGKHDKMLRWEPQADRVIEDLNIAKSDVHVLDYKHFIQEEQPQEISNLICEFVSR